MRYISLRVAETHFELREGFNDRWWNRIVGDEVWEWSSFLDVSGAEVARAECKPGSHAGNAYADVATPADGFVQITFLEVREGKRRAGAGREAVRLLMEAHPGRQLAAFSEHADDFWAALGWQPHIRPGRHALHYRTLFVSPATT
jgi:hypothetical protein